MEIFSKWIENNFDIIDPRDQVGDYSSALPKSQIGVKSGRTINRNNKLPFGMSEYPRKNLITAQTIRVKNTSNQYGGDYCIENDQMKLNFRLLNYFDNQMGIELEADGRYEDPSEEIKQEVLNIVIKIMRKELLKESKFIKNDNFFSTSINSKGNFAYYLAKNLSLKMSNLVKEIFKGEFYCPYGDNSIEENKKPNYSWIEFLQHFSKEIDNSFDWRPKEKIPEDDYAQ